jgi:hypothetical protein
LLAIGFDYSVVLGLKKQNVGTDPACIADAAICCLTAFVCPLESWSGELGLRMAI